MEESRAMAVSSMKLVPHTVARPLGDLASGWPATAMPKVATSWRLPSGISKSFVVAATGASVLALSGGRHAGQRRKGIRAQRSKATRRAAVGNVGVGQVAVGKRVQWCGTWGTAKYVGSVNFAAGEWIGIELDEPKGLHNGTVFKQSYYACQPKYGVFCQPFDLEATEDVPAVISPPVQAASSASVTGIAVGATVAWKGTSGVVQHVGKVDFADGEWIGIALEADKGVHNGELFGKRYFSCAPKRGIFCKPYEVEGAAPAAAAAPVVSAPQAAVPVAAAPQAAVPAAVPASTPSAGGVAVGQKVTWNAHGAAGTVAYVGSVDFADGSWVGLQLDEAKGMHDGELFGKRYFSCQSKHGVFCQAAELTVGGTAPVAAPPAPPVATPAVAAPAAPTPAAASPSSAASSGYSVGQQVSWKGNSGTVKFVGKPDFASEEMVGIALDEAKGMHNGSLFGKSYYSCQDKHGVFCKATDLGASTTPTPAAPAPVSAPAPTPTPVSAPAPVPIASSPATAPATSEGVVTVGQKVTWQGKAGTVKFVGKPDFASEQMVGIDLDEAKGMHNGSLFGKTYFSCQDKHGVFCKAAELGGGSTPAPAVAPPAPVAAANPPAPVAAASPPAPAAAPAAVASQPSSGGMSVGQKVSWKGNSGTVKFVGKPDFASEEMVGIDLDEAKGMHDGSLFGKTYFSCQAKHGVFCKVSELSGGISAPAAAPPAPAATPSPAPPATPVAAPAVVAAATSGNGQVAVGAKVSWRGNTGTVQYVGPVDFAAGQWVGVDLAEARGVHDGSVFGTTYFACQPKHGIFCQASELGGSIAPAGASPAPAAAPRTVMRATPPAPTPTAVASSPVAVGTAALAGAMNVGSTVLWKGKEGVVKYLGPVDFAAGEWIGIELASAKGLHDGSVFGKSYYKCQMGHGIFSQVGDLQRA